MPKGNPGIPNPRKARQPSLSHPWKNAGNRFYSDKNKHLYKEKMRDDKSRD